MVSQEEFASLVLTLTDDVRKGLAESAVYYIGTYPSADFNQILAKLQLDHLIRCGLLPSGSQLSTFGRFIFMKKSE